MNYNISAYVVFTCLVVFIIVYVGKYFYTNGRVFIISLFGGNVSFADHINKLLLVGYYLINIGYALLKLKQWPRISSLQELLSSLAINIGALILLLALLHYLNMWAIYFLSKSNSITHKSFQS